MILDDLIGKVVCGDCLPILKTLPDKCIDLVLTDPPYGINYQANTIKDGKFEEIANDKDLSFFEPFFKEMIRVLKDDSHFYIFFSWKTYPLIFKIVEPYLKNMLIIKRRKPSQGDLANFSNNYEICLFGAKGWRDFNSGLVKVSPTSLKDNRYEGDGFLKRYPALIDNFYNSEFDMTQVHPTQKNLDLMMFLTGISSKPNDLILDPFLGSGTTAVACKKLNRRYIGIEISEDYCKIARQRLAQGVLNF